MKPIENLVLVVNSQREFWRRELGAEVFFKDDNFEKVITSIIDSGICPVIQIDNNLEELNFLEKLPEKSFIGWLHADEVYDLDFNHRVLSLSSIRLLLRPYKISNFSIWQSIKSCCYTFLNLNLARNAYEVLKLIRWQIRGISMQFRQSKILKLHIKHGVPTLNIPLGYTDIFAKSFIASTKYKKIQESGSLFELDVLTQDKIPASQLSFVGQSGQIVRKVATRSLRYATESLLIEHVGFGASNVIDAEVQEKGFQYVEISRNSRYILSPPGNISGETFRTYESFLLNRIPLVMNNVTSDSSFSHDYEFYSLSKSFFSWKSLIEKAQILSNEDYFEIVSVNRSIQKNGLATLKKELNRITNVV
jgi:hypothetical protein